MIPHSHNRHNSETRFSAECRHSVFSFGASAISILGFALSCILTGPNLHANANNLDGADPIVQTPEFIQPPLTAQSPSTVQFQNEPPAGVFQKQLAVARQLQAEGHCDAAADSYVSLLRGNVPADMKRTALLELGAVHHENKQLAKAQQILAQFIQQHPRDYALPEVLLRQGRIFREMGAYNLAIAKFYAVMTAALSLKLEQFEHYQQLVRLAQTAIADTYYETGQYREAVDFFSRLLKQDPARPDFAPLQFRLIQSYSQIESHPDTITHSQAFLRDHPDSPDAAHVQLLLADAFKAQGRDSEALQQILLLLQSQHALASNQPETWHYWQRRAGNELANALYLQADYLNALTLYRRLAELDPSPAWQLPAYYQIALILERLEQPDEAAELYNRILDRQKGVALQGSQPGLDTLFQITKVRKDHLDWLLQARAKLLTFHNEPPPPESQNP